MTAATVATATKSAPPARKTTASSNAATAKAKPAKAAEPKKTAAPKAASTKSTSKKAPEPITVTWTWIKQTAGYEVFEADFGIAKHYIPRDHFEGRTVPESFTTTPFAV